MPNLVFKNFKGVNLQNGQWQNGFAKYIRGIDIYGLNDNKNKISFPGVAQCSLRTSAMEQASSVSAVTESIQDFAYYEDASITRHYAIGRANPGRIYRLDNSGSEDTWTWLSSINVSGLGNNLQDYSGNLYYATNTHIGVYNGTSGNANWQSFTDTITSPRDMTVFGGSLFVGAGRYVSKYDGVTWTEQKLTLPDGFIVRSIEVYSDRLYISADDLTMNKIFVWDGVSTTFEDGIVVGDESRGVSLVASNGLLWAVTNRGTSIPTNQVFVFNGNTFDPIFLLPVQRSNDFAPPGGFSSYKTGVLIGGGDTGASNYEDGTAGCWYVGRDAVEGDYYASLLYDANGSVTGKTVDGIFTAGNLSPNSRPLPVLFGTTVSGPTYEIGTLDTENFYTHTSGSWQTLPIDAGDSTVDKVWRYIEFDTDPDIGTTDSVTIKYRLDYASSFTTLKTLTSSSDMKKKIPIRKRGRVIEIRFEINSSSSDGTRVHSFKLNYDLTTQ